MSKSADYLNTLPQHERDAIIKLMKAGKLVLCDDINEALAAIEAVSYRRKCDA